MNKAPSLMVVLGLKIAVLDLSLILITRLELLCRNFAPLINSQINDEQTKSWPLNCFEHTFLAYNID